MIFLIEIVILYSTLENFMQNESNDKPPKGQGPKKIRLPFEPRPVDIGSWSFDHRAGICITLIAYLLFGIAFVGAKIRLSEKSSHAVILVDFPEEEQPRPDPEQLRRLEAQQDDYRNISNRLSNENAELNPDLRDDRGTNPSEIYDQANALTEGMNANREAYEAGLARERQMIEDARRGEHSSSDVGQNQKYSGRVMVSFSLENPTRNGSLITPGYQCEGGGEVVVNITVNQNGRVIESSINRSLSSGGDCIYNTALREAQRARFNVDPSAPAKHRGTITYIFVPQ